MRESEYQSKIIKKYKKEGWFVLRLITTNVSGTPDLVMFKEGHKPLFIEVKAKKGVVSKLQEYFINNIQKYGCSAKIMRHGTDKL